MTEDTRPPAPPEVKIGAIVEGLKAMVLEENIGQRLLIGRETFGEIARLIGTIQALQNVAGSVFLAHSQGNQNAADIFYEVLTSIDVTYKI